MKTEDGREIIYIEIDDWNPINYPEIDDLVYKILDNDKTEEVFFNYSVYNIDMALMYNITTTEEDLREHGWLNLMNHQVKNPDDSVLVMFPKYNPEIWHDQKKNGRWIPYETIHIGLYMFIDRFGHECMTNRKPTRIDDKEQEIRETYKDNPERMEARLKALKNFREKSKFDNGSGWVNDCVYTEPIKYKLSSVLYLPPGFIKKYLGHKMTMKDEPVHFNYIDYTEMNLFEDDEEEN